MFHVSVVLSERRSAISRLTHESTKESQNLIGLTDRVIRKFGDSDEEWVGCAPDRPGCSACGVKAKGEIESTTCCSGVRHVKGELRPDSFFDDEACLGIEWVVGVVGVERNNQVRKVATNELFRDGIEPKDSGEKKCAHIDGVAWLMICFV